MEKLTSLSSMEYFQKLYEIFSRRYAVFFLIGVVIAVVFSRYYGVAINVSYSLPHKLYLIDKSYKSVNRFKHGDYVAFAWQGDFYPIGTQVLKEVAGLPGDTVTQRNRQFFINEKGVGYAKEKSLDGMPLEANRFNGVLPEKFMWIKGNHKDSLDSRYQITGLIHSGQIIGRAYPIF